jgi:RNA-directed DNA polymerase
MKEPYVEGVANHDGPESCAGVREGVGEALTGVRAGRVLSREINEFEVPTLLSEAEGNTPAAVVARRWVTSRGRRPLARAESFCARTGRSTRRSRRMAPWAASGRPEAVRR